MTSHETHSRPVPGGRAHWVTERLWAAAADLPVQTVPIDAIPELDMDCWFGGQPATCRAVAEHARRINEANLGFPILLSADGRLMDGGHRIAKALLLGERTVPARRFVVDPEPDWITPAEYGDPSAAMAHGRSHPPRQDGLRAAVFSDVHGNLTALDAVLADANAACVDELWVIGDLVAHGPHPAATIQRLMKLSNARFVKGNTDRYVVTGNLSGILPPIDVVRSLEDVPVLVSAASAFAWTRGAVTAAGGYGWLASLPLEQRVTLPDGTRVLLVHAAPGRDDGPGIRPGMTVRELLDSGLADAHADLVFVGHTHLPTDRTVRNVRVVNLGSVSLPATSDSRAMWTLLTADRDGFTVERRFAQYDVEAVLAALDEENHPSAQWLRTRFAASRG